MTPPKDRQNASVQTRLYADGLNQLERGDPEVRDLVHEGQKISRGEEPDHLVLESLGLFPSVEDASATPGMVDSAGCHGHPRHCHSVGETRVNRSGRRYVAGHFCFTVAESAANVVIDAPRRCLGRPDPSGGYEYCVICRSWMRLSGRSRMRGPNGRCIGWSSIRNICGDPPTTRCTLEGANAATADAGRLGIKPTKTRKPQPHSATAGNARDHHLARLQLPLNPVVTQETIQATICVPGWTKTIRPPVSYTSRVKITLNRREGLQGAFG